MKKFDNLRRALRAGDRVLRPEGPAGVSANSYLLAQKTFRMGVGSYSSNKHIHFAAIPMRHICTTDIGVMSMRAFHQYLAGRPGSHQSSSEGQQAQQQPCSTQASESNDDSLEHTTSEQDPASPSDPESSS